MIYRAIFASPVGRRLIVLLTVLVVAILVTSYGQIVLNAGTSRSTTRSRAAT